MLLPNYMIRQARHISSISYKSVNLNRKIETRKNKKVIFDSIKTSKLAQNMNFLESGFLQNEPFIREIKPIYNFITQVQINALIPVLTSVIRNQESQTIGSFLNTNFEQNNENLKSQKICIFSNFDEKYSEYYNSHYFQGKAIKFNFCAIQSEYQDYNFMPYLCNLGNALSNCFSQGMTITTNNFSLNSLRKSGFKPIYFKNYSDFIDKNLFELDSNFMQLINKKFIVKYGNIAKGIFLMEANLEEILKNTRKLLI